MPQPLSFLCGVQIAVGRDHAGASGVCVNGSREDVPGDHGARLDCAHHGLLANGADLQAGIIVATAWTTFKRSKIAIK